MIKKMSMFHQKKYMNFAQTTFFFIAQALKQTDDSLINDWIKTTKCSITSSNLIKNPNFALWTFN